MIQVGTQGICIFAWDGISESELEDALEVTREFMDSKAINPFTMGADEVLSHLAAPGQRLVLTSLESFERPPKGQARSLKEMLGDRYPATAVGQVGHREMVFLTNYAPPP